MDLEWCKENQGICVGIIILVILLLLWYFEYLTFGKKEETVVAFRTFEDAAASKYADVTRDAGGMTANDHALEIAFMSGQTT